MTAGRESLLVAALREAKDTLVAIQAEPFDAPRGWLVKRCRRAVERIDAALLGQGLTVEWVDDGWFVCDAQGPVEGAYDDKTEAEAAREARVS